jgi:hypothetical protein
MPLLESKNRDKLGVQIKRNGRLYYRGGERR